MRFSGEARRTIRESSSLDNLNTIIIAALQYVFKVPANDVNVSLMSSYTTGSATFTRPA